MSYNFHLRLVDSVWFKMNKMMVCGRSSDTCVSLFHMWGFFSRCICQTIFLDCDKGMYGHECSGTCGHCDDVDLCSPINGTCFNGCDAGYQGEFCTTSEYNTYISLQDIFNLGLGLKNKR